MVVPITFPQPVLHIPYQKVIPQTVQHPTHRSTEKRLPEWLTDVSTVIHYEFSKYTNSGNFVEANEGSLFSSLIPIQMPQYTTDNKHPSSQSTHYVHHVQ